MARISMRNVQKSSVSEYFDLYLSLAAARGVKDKTLQTYKNHFRSIVKRMDVTIPMNSVNSQDLEDMILSMREEGLSANSINSYTRISYSQSTVLYSAKGNANVDVDDLLSASSISFISCFQRCGGRTN